ncbi:hypothetical protein IFM62136_05023 [Aspergillus lentulus]|nr:hypothetical protein IFM62136_05023 [Aspergillus lentulus]
MTFWDDLTEDEKRSSVDRTCPREFRDGSAWEAAGRVKEKWDEDVYPNLKAFLNEKHKDLNPTSRKMAIYSIVCWMVGKEWHLSHPATVFVCGTKKVAKRALKQIECFLKLGNSGFRAYTHIATISLNCGASGNGPSGKIGLCGTLVNVGNFYEAFERQTTVGGVVHIDGYYYCMTAAHPFLSVDDDCDDCDDDSDVGNESFGEDSEVGDNNTIENKNLTADHIYRDCLHSFLGAIPLDDDASHRKSFLSERFDWALLKVSDECEPGLNKINVPGGILIPWKISATPPKTPLWAATGTHQAVEIQSTPTLSGICLDNSGILDVWSLNMMSYPGDSGSWVVDPHDDSIVAIVIARCEALNATYALSARDVFNDIARNIGQTIDLTVADNGSLLTLAAKQGKADLVEEILGQAIYLDSRNEMEWSAIYDNALLEASAEGHERTVQLLLDHGADVDAQGGSALLAASKEGHCRTVQLLLGYGADINTQSGSALLEASKEGHYRTVQLLLDHGADVNSQSESALLAASKEGHYRIVQLLLDHGADANTQGGSALLAALKEGHYEIVQLLLDHGADANAQSGSALLNRPADLAPALNTEAHQSTIRHHAIYAPMPGIGSDHAYPMGYQSASDYHALFTPISEIGSDHAYAEAHQSASHRRALYTPISGVGSDYEYPEAHQSASHHRALYTPISGVGSDHSGTHSTSEPRSPLLGTLRSRNAYSINEESQGISGPLLDLRYQVQRSPDSFFVVGRVFGILWHEDKGQQRTVIPDNISQGRSTQSQSTQSRLGEEVFSSIQHMVVVKAMSQCAWCLPITTYNGKGVAKPGVNPAEHAIVYMQGSVPTCKADEPRMTKEPLEVEPARPNERLDEMSRLNFGKVYRVEHNAKVRHVGMISWTSMVKFRGYVSNAFRLDI